MNLKKARRSQAGKLADLYPDAATNRALLDEERAAWEEECNDEVEQPDDRRPPRPDRSGR